MKHKTLLFKTSMLFVSIFLSATLQAQTLLYSNDFESGLNGATIVGNGVIEASGDAAHGQVFHNDPTLTNAVRTNYMLLPSTIFSDFQATGTQGLTVSFWVNKSNATNYYWTAMFGAYGVAPNPTNAKPALTLMSRSTGLVNFDYVNTVNSTNYSYADFSGTGTASTGWLDAGGWHFYTFTITPTTAKVYVDGAIKNTWTFDGTSTNSVNGLFNVASEIKYIALGGNQAWGWNDPDPAFQFDKIKIYSGALTATQINSLIATDGLTAPFLNSSKPALYFDDKYTSETLTLNGASLSQDITITAPAGITVSPASISKSEVTAVPVLVTYDGTTVVKGNITLTSGSTVINVSVKSSSNVAYVPAYATGNMIADPTFSAATLSAGGFVGWGTSILTYTNAYCGRGTAYIFGNCSGSIDRALTTANGNALLPNTSYRLHAMVNSKASTGKAFEFQVEGVNGAASLYYLIKNTNGWKQIDTTFTTGATVSEHGIYFNSCYSPNPLLVPLATDTCFIDNYELYKVANVTGLNNASAKRVTNFIRNNKVVTTFNLESATEVSVSLYAVNGMLIETKKSIYQSGLNENVLNSHLSSGIYLVKTSIDGKLTINKIVL